jgi:hypothetical protein
LKPHDDSTNQASYEENNIARLYSNLTRRKGMILYTKRVGEGVIMVYFKVLTQHLLAGGEKNHEIC